MARAGTAQKAKGRPGEKLEWGSRLLEECGKPRGLEWRILEVSRQLFFVVCAHRSWWGWSIQGRHNWLRILSFTHTQGLLGRNPTLFAKTGIFSFYPFLSDVWAHRPKAVQSS